MEGAGSAKKKLSGKQSLIDFVNISQGFPQVLRTWGRGGGLFKI